MGKVIRQKGKDSEIDLNWAVDRAQESYELLFNYLDELAMPHKVNEKQVLVDNSKTLVNSLVRALKMATVLSSEDAVLNSLFPGFDVEIVEKVEPVENVIEYSKSLNGEKPSLDKLKNTIYS